MVLNVLRKFRNLRLLVCIALLALPVSAFGECRVIDYPDHSEVVCGDDVPSQEGQSGRAETSRLASTSQRDFVFYAPVSPVTKISITADLSPFAIASPGDQILSYGVDVLRDKVHSMTTVSFIYEERSGDDQFTLREEGSGERAEGSKVTQVTFSDKKNHLLLMPFNSGCPPGADGAVYLKMNRIEGNQLYYQIVLPACLSKPVEQSITE